MNRTLLLGGALPVLAVGGPGVAAALLRRPVLLRGPGRDDQGRARTDDGIAGQTSFGQAAFAGIAAYATAALTRNDGWSRWLSLPVALLQVAGLRAGYGRAMVLHGIDLAVHER